MMAVKHCSMCNLDYPTLNRVCTKCGGATDLISNVKLRDDWQEVLEAAMSALPPSKEGDRVRDWRNLQLLNSGFDQSNALLLACSTVDLRRAHDLLARGCPEVLAMEILL